MRSHFAVFFCYCCSGLLKRVTKHYNLLLFLIPGCPQVKGTRNVFNRNTDKNPPNLERDTYQGIRRIQNTKLIGPKVLVYMSYDNQNIECIKP